MERNQFVVVAFHIRNASTGKTKKKDCKVLAFTFKALTAFTQNVPDASPLQMSFFNLKTNIHIAIIVPQQDFVLIFFQHALVWREVGTTDPHQTHQASSTFTFSIVGCCPHGVKEKFFNYLWWQRDLR